MRQIVDRAVPEGDDVVGVMTLFIVIIVRNLLLHVGPAGVEVRQVDQLAGLHVLLAAAVVGILDIALAVIVLDPVNGAGVILAAVGGARNARPAFAIGRVVDDRIDVDFDAGGVAAVDHLFERGPIAAATCHQVADRLVARPPLGALDVLVRRRDLHRGVALLAEIGALPGDVVPAPLEQVDEDAALPLSLGLSRGRRGQDDRRGNGLDCEAKRCGPDRGRADGGFHTHLQLPIRSVSSDPGRSRSMQST